MQTKFACAISIGLGLLVFGAAAQQVQQDHSKPSTRSREQRSGNFTAPVHDESLVPELRPAPPASGSSKPDTPTCNPGDNLLSNGGFESGTADWSFKYGYVYAKEGKKAKIKWKKKSDQPDPMVIDATSPLLPQQGVAIAPYCESHMLRINDLVGNSHVTQVRQRITLGAIGPCSRMSITWGAMLEEATEHSEERSAKVNIQIKRKQGKKRLKLLHTYSANAREGEEGGWDDIRATGGKNPIWYKKNTFTQSLSDFKKGDQIEILLTVMDCVDGGHGGAAFLDCAEILDPCSGDCPDPSMSAIPDPVIPNVFTPNGDGINDEWSISNVSNACRVHADIYNRWGNHVAWTEAFKATGFTGEVVPLWDGVRIKGNGKRKRKVPASESPFSYVLKLDNCADSKSYPGFFYMSRCLADPVVSDEGGGILQGFAEVGARSKWRQKVRSQHGNPLANWERAADKDITCHKVNKRWHCVATARPCGK
jgi:gliding motility-associated-like protein